MSKPLFRLVLALFIGPLIFISLQGQSPTRFQEEINQFKADKTDYSKSKNLILFTGSSTIRMWTSLKDDFPERNVLNRGFGGSYMSELLYYADTLILPYKPRIIFIYEGDNDLGSGQKADDILESARLLVEKIHRKLPHSTICFFSAKPSLARWNLHETFVDFNRRLEQFTRKYKRVYYLDTWTPMIGADGNVKNDLFLADGLHMNRKGYDIWKEAVNEFLDHKLKR
jgi:lysophospholipase L1-like esterase